MPSNQALERTREDEVVFFFITPQRAAQRGRHVA